MQGPSVPQKIHSTPQPKADEQILKKNKASFIIKQPTSLAESAQESPASPSRDIKQKLMPKDSKSFKKHLREIESFNLSRVSLKTETEKSQKESQTASKAKPSQNHSQKMLDQALNDTESRNRLNKVKQLFGDAHAESRGLLNEL